MGGRIERLAFGDYTSFFTNKKIISCVGRAINVAINLTSIIHYSKKLPRNLSHYPG